MSSNDISHDIPEQDTVISVRNLTKTYRLFGHPGDRIKQFLSLGLKQYHRKFTALKDVSFDIKKGETVGIIGRNGSGKSTLLQLICGILKPTSGTVQVNGRVSALLELGAGFNPEFTGRENVYFQGALMGFTKAQMDEKFDGIAAFSDIGEFIEQPVRVYSSGMYVRLAFATAIHTDPDLLIVDEALAVGDAAFQHKCYRKVAALREVGCSIVLVSHDLRQVARMFNRVILLDKGRIADQGEPLTVLKTYRDSIYTDNAPARPPINNKTPNPSGPSENSTLPKWKSYFLINENAQRHGNRLAEVLEAGLFDVNGAPLQLLERGTENKLKVRVLHHETIKQPIIAYSITDTHGIAICGTSSLMQNTCIPSVAAGTVVEYTFCQKFIINPGIYMINIGYSCLEYGAEIQCDLRVGYMQFETIATSERAGYFDPMSTISWNEAI